MIQFTQGNLLEDSSDALVNTVNTVGIMGKGIALMFKEKFPANFRAYHNAFMSNELSIRKMHVFETHRLIGPKYIVNFPTKTHWRTKTRLAWVCEGLEDLKRVIRDHHISSIALPPLGCGNGGLNWFDVKDLITSSLSDLDDVAITIYEPTTQYLNISKKVGVEKLTVARAAIAESVRRYNSLGMDSTLLEVQKLAWFLMRASKRMSKADLVSLNFKAATYGPYSQGLTHLLNSLDGSYLRSEKRLADAGPFDLIWFNESRSDHLYAYLNTSEAADVLALVQSVSERIKGFETPLGMELLSTLDWLIFNSQIPGDVASVRRALDAWPGGQSSARRKQSLFEDWQIKLGLERLAAA